MNKAALSRAGLETHDDIAVFLPYQQRWILDRSRVKIAVKSRQVGITWSTAYEAVEVACASKKSGGSDFWYQTYAQEDALEFINDAAMWARAFEQSFEIEEEELSEEESHEYFILPEGEKSIKIRSIVFKSGFRVTALPHSPRKLRGKHGVYCLDEAAFHGDIRGALKAAHAFRMWGGRVIIISTHNGVENHFNKLIEEVKAGKHPSYSVHEIDIYQACSEGLFKRICRIKNEEWSQEYEDAWIADLLDSEGAEEEFLCIPARSGGQYISSAVIEARMEVPAANVIRFERNDEFVLLPEEEREKQINDWLNDKVLPILRLLPSAHAHYYGQDFGRSSDLSAIAIGFLSQSLSLIVRYMIELANVPYESQKQIAVFILQHLPRFAFACIDSTGNGAYLGESLLQKFGETKIEACKVNDPWYAETLPKMKARFDDGTISIPRDADIKQDIALLSTINGVPKLPKKRLAAVRPGVRELRHGDAAIALACICRAATHQAPKTAYEKVPKRAGLWASKGAMF